MGESVSQAPVVLVGGNDLFRRGLDGFLKESAFRTIAEFDRVEECLDPLDGKLEPEIIIYVTTGVTEESEAAVDRLCAVYAQARIVLVSFTLSVDELGACLRVGASGYLLSSISKDAFIHSLTLITLGETVFPSSLATAWLRGDMDGTSIEDAGRLRDLTPREQDILECLTLGLSNKQMARRLGITAATVKIHMKSLIRKLGVSNRTQAALWALRAGVNDRKPSDAA